MAREVDLQEFGGGRRFGHGAEYLRRQVQDTPAGKADAGGGFTFGQLRVLVNGRQGAVQLRTSFAPRRDRDAGSDQDFQALPVQKAQ